MLSMASLFVSCIKLSEFLIWKNSELLSSEVLRFGEIESENASEE